MILMVFNNLFLICDAFANLLTGNISFLAREKSMKVILLFITCFCFATFVFAKDPSVGRIPDEYEGGWGHTLGFAYGGTVAVSGLDSIKSNPAMLAIEKKYQVSAGYHWPTYGRDFYQLGIVDSKTSSFAAGASYISYQKKYTSWGLLTDRQKKIQAYYDTPIQRRISGAIAQVFGKFFVGVSTQYLDYKYDDKVDNGVTWGIGTVAHLTKNIRIGLSVENMANHKHKEVAPRTYRAGVAYIAGNGVVTLHGDYRQRDRVMQEVLFSKVESAGAYDSSKKLKSSEKLLIGSASVKIQDLLRFVGGYGYDFDQTKRQILALGIALVNKNFSLSYAVNRPYLSDGSYHQAFNMSYNVVL